MTHKNLSKQNGNSSHLMPSFPSFRATSWFINIDLGAVPYRKSLNQKNTRFHGRLHLNIFFWMESTSTKGRFSLATFVCEEVYLFVSPSKKEIANHLTWSPWFPRITSETFGQNSWYIGSGNMLDSLIYCKGFLRLPFIKRKNYRFFIYPNCEPGFWATPQGRRTSWTEQRRFDTSLTASCSPRCTNSWRNWSLHRAVVAYRKALLFGPWFPSQKIVIIRIIPFFAWGFLKKPSSLHDCH